MNVLRPRLIRPLLAAAGLLVFGCASPPEAEKKAAHDAVSLAKSAGADRYAASEFTVMTAAVKKAEAEMTAQAYKEAKASYVRVKDLADNAARAALSGKAAMKAELEKQLGLLVQRWEDLQGKVQAVAKKMKAEQKRLWDADAKTVAAGLGAAKVAVVTDLGEAKQRLAPIGATLDKWEADLVVLTAPVERPPAKGKS